MSSLSLEERRAERRRRREMEAESLLTKTPEEIEADLQERLAQRRKEREDRMAALSSSYATVNGEDDLERRRRERREARLREKTDTSTDDTYSYRSRRRESDEPTEDSYSSYSSYRSRRRRNWDDEDTAVNDTPSVPDTSAEDSAAERRRRQREEEEEARQQQEREEEEERQRQAEQEERRRQEEDEDRRRAEEEEERRRQEEEENERRRKEVEEERRRQEILRAVEDEQFSDASEDNTSDGDDKKPIDNTLFIDEDALEDSDVHILNSRVEVSDKLDRVRKWNEESNHVSDKGSSVTNGTYRNSVTLNLGDSYKKDIKRNSSEPDDIKSKRVLDRSSSFKEINNNKIKDKLEKFEHLKKDESPKRASSVVITRIERRVQEQDGLKGKLKKFEQEIKDQKTPTLKADPPKKQPPGYTTPAQKLSDKLQHFETAARSQSATKTSNRNIQFELEKTGSKRDQRQALLGRWSVSESQIHKSPPVKETPSKKVLERWKSIDKQEEKPTKALSNGDDQSRKRLSGGNIQFKAAIYLEKANKSIDESQTGLVSKSPGTLQKQPFERRTSQSSGNQSDYSEILSPNQSRSRVTDRWQFGEAVQTDLVAHSRGSSMDNSNIHSRGSSMDASSERSWRNSYNDQEEEERLEQARLEKQRMAEKSKKRKGLGGLTPEKKKKLKQIIMQKAAEDLKKEALAKAKEKEAFVNSKLEPIEVSGMGEAELKKLCKMLHQKLTQIHSEVYDWEYKVGKQEQEVTELTMKVNDSRGKFVKPVLRKVNKSTN